MIPRIIYDKTCPVCTNYMRLVKRKLGNDIEYYPAETTESDFHYVAKDGKEYSGVKAIEVMANDFPAIKEYMYILPPAYKTIGLKAAYKVGGIVRKAIGVIKKGCNCGNKK